MPEASLRYVIVYEHGRTRSSRTEYMLGSRNAHSRDPNERYDHVIKRVLSG